MTVGPRKTVAVAHRLGIGSRLRADASLALGTSEVTLLELTSAYAVLANGGRAPDPHIVQRVRSLSGEMLFERRPQPDNVLVAPAQVVAMNDMLGAVLTSGTGRRAALPGHQAAGKTGTSQDFRDAWFVGYTAHFVAGVWVGNDDGRSMNRVMGGNFPARLWREVMLLAHEGVAPRALPGTAPTSPAVALNEPANVGQAQLTRVAEEPDAIARVIAEDASGKVQPAKASTRTWTGATLDSLRRSFGLGG